LLHLVGFFFFYELYYDARIHKHQEDTFLVGYDAIAITEWLLIVANEKEQ
jgi:hypothetical protein